MAILPILQAPDERLHTVAKPVQSIDSGIRGLIRHMTETMYAAGGIGLAATQVDVHRRVVTIDVSPGRNGLLVFINPVIQQIGGKAEFTEGCLSVPGVFETVRRAGWVNVHALDGEGKRFKLRAEGLLAMCLQHEIDHLQGMHFIEYLPRLRRSQISSRLGAAPDASARGF
ncbi:MAG: peptide deformylase [Gemmatimonadaceae bacterium]